ncbi:MAG: glycoside hydrolase family 2, partial [bacterium]|jgi:exo-1,4-beta-D-glucosaminidase|nr:glycoside hydrolase family 2 [bacterium]
VDERFGGVHEPEEIALVGQSWEDQLLWLRHHPSIYVWAVASDKVPHPALERRYLQTFETYDPTRPYLCSTGGVGSEQKIIGTEVIVSEVSGSSGIKMLGPYDYTPPVYWYTDSTRGGAFGFNSETGPGAQVPPLASLRKMLPSAHLWPVDAVWNFHCARNEFDRLDRFLGAMEQRYGQPTSLEDFDRKAQILNYELMRPMFEAFLINQPRATGIIQWMLNAAWPKMYWQLYDSYLMPNGAFYAARKACTPLHLAYHYGNRGIYLLNQHRESVPDLLAVFRVLDQRGEEIYCESIKTESPAHSSVLLSTLHEWDAMPRLYFLDLRLYDGAMRELDTNFYWLSSQPDELDYTAEVRPWAFYTPSAVYADFRLLHALPPTVVTIETTVCRGQGKTTVDVILQNQEDHMAFGLEFHLLDARTGEVCLPVFWDDNYIALLPGERRTLRAVLDGESHDLVVQGLGWNCPVIPA